MSTTITNQTLINWNNPIALDAKGRLTEEEITDADKWADRLANQLNEDIKEEIVWYLELLQSAITNGKDLNVYKLHTLLKKLQNKLN